VTVRVRVTVTVTVGISHPNPNPSPNPNPNLQPAARQLHLVEHRASRGEQRGGGIRRVVGVRTHLGELRCRDPLRIRRSPPSHLSLNLARLALLARLANLTDDLAGFAALVAPADLTGLDDLAELAELAGLSFGPRSLQHSQHRDREHQQRR